MSRETEFENGQIVYFIEQNGLNCKIQMGKFDSYDGGGTYYLKIYRASENSDNEYFVTSVKVGVGDIFSDYGSAKQEFEKREKKLKLYRKKMDEMSDYEYTMWEAEQTIQYLTEKSKNTVRGLIILLDVPNIFSMKIANGKFKYKYFNGEYIDLCDVEYAQTEYEKKREIEDKLTEQYLVTVLQYRNSNRVTILRKFTDDSPETIFKKHGKDQYNILEIINRRWKLEDGLKTPVGYRVGYNINGDRILVAKYKFANGTFDIREGGIGDFDIYLNRLHKISNMGLRSFSKVKSKIFQSQIDRALKNKLTNMMGKEFSQMIIDKLDLE